MHVVRESTHSEVKVNVVGLERMKSLSHHESSLRIAEAEAEVQPA